MNHLTEREQQIVRLVARGLSDKEIAGEFGTSVHTVRNQQSSIKEKTGARNRTELAVLAVRSGMEQRAAC